MPRQRPTSVTVMAILNMVFGGINLVSLLCVGAALLILVLVLNSLASSTSREAREFREVFESLQREAPWMVWFLVALIAVSLIFSAVLFFSGLGLWRLRPWGRTASIVYALVTIVVQVGMVAFQIVLLNPAMSRWQQALLSRQSGPGTPPPYNPMAGNEVVNNASAVLGGLLGLTYAVILLVVMFRPAVRAAFRGEEPAGPPRLEDERDEYEPGERWRDRDL